MVVGKAIWRLPLAAAWAEEEGCGTVTTSVVLNVEECRQACQLLRRRGV